MTYVDCMITAVPTTNKQAYLDEVLQRVSEHPSKDVIELTPRVWKSRFADNPLRSDLTDAV